MTYKTLPKPHARIAGLFYLFIIVFGLIAQVFVRDRLVDYGNATDTANNIIASEFLFRFGFVSELIMLVSDTIVTLILYILLREVSRNLALLSIFFRLLSISILSVTALNNYDSVIILKDSQLPVVFDAGQQHALALLSVKLHGSGYNISLIFFGIHLLFMGYLVFKSGAFPKILGLMLQFGGLCYISNSFIWFLFPTFVTTIYPAILIPCFLAELFLCLWLLLYKVKVL